MNGKELKEKIRDLAKSKMTLEKKVSDIFGLLIENDLIVDINDWEASNITDAMVMLIKELYPKDQSDTIERQALAIQQLERKLKELSNE